MKYAIEVTSLEENMGEFECGITIEAESFDDAWHKLQLKLKARELKWEPRPVYGDEIKRIWVSLNEE